MKIGNKIQNLRDKKGLSQEDLASKIGVDIQSIQDWENNSSLPEINKLLALSELFNVSLDYLLKDEVVEESNIGTSNDENNADDIKYMRLKNSKRITINVFLILGGIFTFLANSIFSFFYLSNLIFVFVYAFISFSFITALCILTMIFLKMSYSKKTIILWGILSLLFVSFVGGLLILCIKESDYISHKKEFRYLSDNSLSEEEKNHIKLIRERTKVFLNNSYTLFKEKAYSLKDKKAAKLRRNELIIKSRVIYKDEESTDILEEYDSYLSTFKEDIEKHKKERAITAASISIGLVAVLVTTAVSISVNSHNNLLKKYNNAITELNEGNYADAYESFTNLNNFKDSSNKAKLCDGLNSLKSLLLNKSSKDHEIEEAINKILDAKERVDITFYNTSEDNDKPTTISYYLNNSFELPTPPMGEKYYFSYWLERGILYKDEVVRLELYGVWHGRTFYINYHFQDETEKNHPNNPQTFTYGTSKSLLPATKPNHSFKYWSLDSFNGEKITNIDGLLYRNIDLYAHFEINSYTVKFYNYNFVLLYSCKVEYGGTAVYPYDPPTRPNDIPGIKYVFDGWDQSLENIVADMSVTALFRAVSSL